MRWKEKTKELEPIPADGTVRTKTGFLWFPLLIDGEYRWLEWAVWEETYHHAINVWDEYFWWDSAWVSP